MKDDMELSTIRVAETDVVDSRRVGETPLLKPQMKFRITVIGASAWQCVLSLTAVLPVYSFGWLSCGRYTNEINPFGDSNLTEQFVWGKKKEKEGTADQLVTKREQRDSQKKNVEEIEKVLPCIR